MFQIELKTGKDKWEAVQRDSQVDPETKETVFGYTRLDKAIARVRADFDDIQEGCIRIKSDTYEEYCQMPAGGRVPKHADVTQDTPTNATLAKEDSFKEGQNPRVDPDKP